MRVLAFGALALVLLCLESALVKSLGLSAARLDVTVALVVFLGLRATTLEGAVAAYTVGYVLDVFTGRPTGLYAFLAVLTFLAFRAAGSLVDGRARGTFAVLVGAAAAGHSLLALLLTWLTSASPTARQAVGVTGVPIHALLSAAAGWLLFPLLRRLEPKDRAEPGLLR